MGNPFITLHFNYGESAIIKMKAGLNNYKISVKEWQEKTNSVGLKATAGRYGGTYAHPNIAFNEIVSIVVYLHSKIFGPGCPRSAKGQVLPDFLFYGYILRPSSPLSVRYILGSNISKAGLALLGSIT